MPRLFAPNARQLNLLIAVGLLSLGYAMYLRYLVIEFSQVGLACQAGLDAWLCVTRKVVIALFQHSVFGAVALGAAVINLIRPSLAVLTIGLSAAAFGLVLYNTGLSALAAALFILSLARPAPEEEQG